MRKFLIFIVLLSLIQSVSASDLWSDLLEVPRPCADNQIPKWSMGNYAYVCADDEIGAAGVGDITAVYTLGLYLYGGAAVGDVSLYFNETKLNATIDARSTSSAGKSGDPPYLYNDSTVMYFNETKLNETIDARDDYEADTDTHVAGDPPYLYNDSTTMYFNETQANITYCNIVGDIMTGDLVGTWFNGSFNWTVGDDWASFDGDTWLFNASKLSTIYYNKTYVYNKTEVYNKSEVYNKTGVYNISEVYNKTEVWNRSENYNKSEAITYFVNRSDWTTIDDYPASCGAGDFVTELGDTLTCDTPSYIPDTNETLRFNNLTSQQCAIGYFAYNVTDDGILQCRQTLYAQIGDIWVNETGDTMTGQLFIDGSISEVQLLVQQDLAGSADIFVVEDWTGTDLFLVDKGGNAQIKKSATITGTLYSDDLTTVSNSQYINSGSAISGDSSLYIRNLIPNKYVSLFVNNKRVVTVDNDIEVRNNDDTERGELRFYENTSNGVNYIGFVSPNAITSDLIWQLPATDGSDGQVLATNGSAQLEWITPAIGTGSGGNVSASGSTAGDYALFDTDGTNITSSEMRSAGGITYLNEDLRFEGTGRYEVGGNKYAFAYSTTNYGVFFNSTAVEIQFKGGGNQNRFIVNMNNGNVQAGGDVISGDDIYDLACSSHAGKAMCFLANGELGFCSTTVGSAGSCTCNTC